MYSLVLRHAIESDAFVKRRVPLDERVQRVLRVQQVALDEREVEERLGGRDLEQVARAVPTAAAGPRVVGSFARQQTVHAGHKRRRRRGRSTSTSSRQRARHGHRHGHGH